MTKQILLVMLLFHAAFFSKGQDFSLYLKKEFRNEQGNLPYRILYPENFDPGKKYPLILFLHGAGERGNDNEKQLVHGARLFLDPDVRSWFPAVVVFPQCPAESFWVNLRRDTETHPYRRFWFDYSAPSTPPMQMVIALMDSLLKEPFTDTDRVYAGGLSMGGMGTFEILYRLPEIFAAAFPICGGGDTTSVTAYAGKLSLWVFHGGKDQVVPPALSEEMVAAVNTAGGDVKFTLYPEANHNSWDAAFAEPGLLPWLFSQKK